MNKGFTGHNINGFIFTSASDFDDCGDVLTAFTTRYGGVSTGCFYSMNLGFSNDDNPENIRKNYEILCGRLNLDIKSVVLTKQTHCDTVEKVTSKHKGYGFFKNGFSDADALVTNEREITLIVHTADCVPILLYEPEKKVIAAIHSGWRGTVKRIAEKTVKIMTSDYNCSPERILAAIGPSICKSCFEIDKDVAELIASVNKNNEDICEGKNAKFYSDLWSVNRKLLLNAGLKDNNIKIMGECTYCNNDKYYSHRRTGKNRGSLAALICLK